MTSISEVRCFTKRITTIFFLLSALLLCAADIAMAQDSLKVIRGESTNNTWRLFSDSHNSLYNHLADEAYLLLEQRNKKVDQINSLSQWQERQKEIQQILMDIVGPFPEKTPLNAEITSTIYKDAYKVEHIVFESQPGFHVTSSLFIPNNLDGNKAPAILYLSGHYHEAHRVEEYQHVIINLVKKGFIVFAIDPVGQGERLEYYDEETGESMVGGPTSEHSYPGAQAFITGGSHARYMIWDGIRAIDYLQTRDEVDIDRLGITGMSGGGTQTAYIAAFDERVYASAPSNYITSLKRLFQTLGPQDAEQNFFHGILSGIEHADLLAVRAPKPSLILSTTNDFFSIQGARETTEEVMQIYDAYGNKDNFSMVEDVGEHTVTLKNRVALYDFFQRHLNNPGDAVDKDVNILTADELRVTYTGQVSQSYKSETVHSLNRLETGIQMARLSISRENLDTHVPEVLRSAKILSGYKTPEESEPPVFTGRFHRGDYTIDKYFVKGEGNYPIPYILMTPQNSNGRAILYLHHEGKAAEAEPGGEMEWFVKQGFTVLSPDLIGIGEVGPPGTTNELRREWRASILIGRSIAGIRAGDVSRLTKLLRQEYSMDEIYGVARRELAPVLLHAGAFDANIDRVALVEPFMSYRSLVMNRFYETGFVHSTVAGALEAYDLPDLAASLAPRRLMISHILDQSGEVNFSEYTLDDISIIKRSYLYHNASDQLIVSDENVVKTPDDLFGVWIE